ncbi:MAG: [FeFe] hydrogenase H-cluster radical SAM maturase HydE [Gammaproteobacteria bacterium]|nr:[FeFe] hydrogenase H-cluster radical SAM maturase HydE [Gammaproteobacteria bacterium]
MCYAIPAKVIKIKGLIAIVDYFGEKRKILLDLDDIKVGDYVYAQGGILVRKIPQEEALIILEAWKDIFLELQKTDAALSQLDQSQFSQNALAVLQKVNLRKSLNQSEMKTLFELEDLQELSVLYEIANHVRQREHGNACCIHGIIEFSNYCTNNCYYCGIRKDSAIQRYRMDVNEVISVAKHAVDEYGFKALVLQSGEDYWYDEKKLVEVVKAIRAMGVLVFLSIGSRDQALYQKLYDVGARACLLRFETSNEALFDKLRPGTTLKDRVDLIKAIKKMGYVLATGFIIGLPGATLDDLINDILLTRYLMPDMYSFGPLIPTKGTPLANCPMVSKELVLKTIAVSRFVDSNANILVTTALETLEPGAKREGLMGGANSLMINVTPARYRDLYNIYDNKAGNEDSINNNIQKTLELLKSLGRAPTDLGVH